MALWRAVYELYKDMAAGDFDNLDTLQFDAAFALCNGVQAVKIAAQRLYSSSVFDVFDLYFRIPRPPVTKELCDIKLSKRGCPHQYDELYTYVQQEGPPLLLHSRNLWKAGRRTCRLCL